jgi:hypothetical protein
MNAHLLREFHGAYLRMAPFYRPAAPGDGMGHVHLTPEQCRDGPRLYREAYDYAAELVAEDDTRIFHIGCCDYRTAKAFMWTIEAARVLASGDEGSGTAMRLLAMASASGHSGQTDTL